MNNNYEYIEGNKEQLPLLQVLWEKQKNHHKELSTFFSHRYDTITYEKRTNDLIMKSKDGHLYTILVKEKESGRLVGYSISTITVENCGEIDSIYILSQHRGKGIGECLMTMILHRMELYKVKTKKLSIAVGNEKIIDFYKKFGFLPSTITLESNI